MSSWSEFIRDVKARREAEEAAREFDRPVGSRFSVRFSDLQGAAAVLPFGEAVDRIIGINGLVISPELPAYENMERFMRTGSHTGWPSNSERFRINAFLKANGVSPHSVAAYYRALSAQVHGPSRWREFEGSVLSQLASNYNNATLYGYNASQKSLMGAVPYKYASDEAVAHFRRRGWEREMKAKEKANREFVVSTMREAEVAAAKARADRLAKAAAAKAKWQQEYYGPLLVDDDVVMEEK